MIAISIGSSSDIGECAPFRGSSSARVALTLVGFERRSSGLVVGRTVGVRAPPARPVDLGSVVAFGSLLMVVIGRADSVLVVPTGHPAPVVQPAPLEALAQGSTARVQVLRNVREVAAVEL